MTQLADDPAGGWVDRVGLLPAGRMSVLVSVPDGRSPAAIASALRQLAPEVAEAVPAHDSVMISWDRARPDDGEVRSLLARAAAAAVIDGPVEEIEIPIVYDGEDLALVAAACGIGVDEVIELHSQAVYEAAFCGFAPGFAYLTGLPEQLRLARRAEPRIRVPRGSVAIADGYSGVYPSASPGGWHLLGTTQVRLFDPAADRPALITPGSRVRFVP